MSNIFFLTDKIWGKKSILGTLGAKLKLWTTITYSAWNLQLHVKNNAISWTSHGANDFVTWASKIHCKISNMHVQMIIFSCCHAQTTVTHLYVKHTHCYYAFEFCHIRHKHPSNTAFILIFLLMYRQLQLPSLKQLFARCCYSTQ